jgi:hypothetical protein
MHMTLKKVHTYFIQIKNTTNHTFLTSNDIKTALTEISQYTYTRDEANSMLRRLNDDTWHLMDVVVANANNYRINGSKVRDDDLPTVRFSKEEWRQLPKPEGADIIETSLGVLYFSPEVTHGCFLFLKRNVLGMSITSIGEYIKKCYPAYNLSKSIISKPKIIAETFGNVEEVRYLIMDNKLIKPSHNEQLGTYHDRVSHPEDEVLSYPALRVKLDLRQMAGTPLNKIKRVIKDWIGINPTSEQITQFIADSNAQLVAVQHGQTKQEEIDLTKSLYSFDYEDESHTDETFYQFCDDKFNDRHIKSELISLARGLIAHNADVDNQE